MKASYFADKALQYWKSLLDKYSKETAQHSRFYRAIKKEMNKRKL